MFDKSNLLIVVLYVDDMDMIGSQKSLAWCKMKPTSEFDMKDSGLYKKKLGLDVHKNLVIQLRT